MNNLKRIRKQRGITQQDLGRAVGKYQPYICLIEHGYHEPDADEKQALADTLGVAVEEIFPSN